MQEIDLKKYAWDAFFENAKKNISQKKLSHGRVLSVHKTKYELITEKGKILADIIGNLQFQKNPILKPAVGDWVLFEEKAATPVIQKILPRKTMLKRQKKHDTFPKIIAANVDYAFMVVSPGEDFNIQRIERTLIHLNEAKIKSVLLINKSDLINEGEKKSMEAKIRAMAYPLSYAFVSFLKGDDVKKISESMEIGKTYVLIGSSGVGKSSLINGLLGNTFLKTQGLSKKGKGKHTTTRRNLFLLPNDALIIDTPGTREFGIYGEKDEILRESFSLIEAYAQQCYFPNCSHHKEEHCAVRKAISDGILSEEVLRSYEKLKEESKLSAKSIRKKENRRNGSPARSVRRGE